MKTIIAANWKLHMTASEAAKFLSQFEPKGNVYIAPPFTTLHALVNQKGIKVGAQNMSEHRSGAFTGEVSIEMLQDLGVDFVLLGHSERRHIYNESDDAIQKKVHLALEEHLPLILCIGETLQERKGGKMQEVLKRQLTSALEGIELTQEDELIIAYEPVWAIGTGEAATPQIANEAHHYCRSLLAEMIGKNRAQSTTILYGGSVKPENAKELIEQDEINGFLVGGASLKPDLFTKIIEVAK